MTTIVMKMSFKKEEKKSLMNPRWESNSWNWLFQQEFVSYNHYFPLKNHIMYLLQWKNQKQWALGTFGDWYYCLMSWFSIIIAQDEWRVHDEKNNRPCFYPVKNNFICCAKMKGGILPSVIHDLWIGSAQKQNGIVNLDHLSFRFFPFKPSQTRFIYLTEAIFL